MADQLTPQGLARFGKAAASHVGDDKVPGLVALVALGDQVHVETLGSLAIGGPPMRRDSLFRIASISKPVTGVATMALIDEGLLSLDEPVDRLLPELTERRVLVRPDDPLTETRPALRPITVRDLLTFTFGFGMAVEMFMAPSPWPVVAAANELHLGTFEPPSPDEQPDADTWIAALGSLPLLAQPGERWLYNTGASVLGVLLARAAGTSFAEVLQSRVFTPLGMADTGFSAADAGRLATAYQPTPGGLAVFDEPDGQWSHPPAFGDGAGGLVSTADDLLALARMLLGGGAPVLSGGSVNEMTRDQISEQQRLRDGEGILDGRGWALCQSVVVEGAHAGAYGWNGGLGCTWLIDPAHELVMIVMTQRAFENPQAPPVHRDLQAAAYAAVA